MQKENSMWKVRGRARNKKMHKRRNEMCELQERTCRLVSRMLKAQRNIPKDGDTQSRNSDVVFMLVNNELRILQNNLHKSQARTHSILNHPDTNQYAILLLQEQYWSSYTKSSLRHPSWTLYEPTTLNNEQPRSAIYVNNNLLSAAQITHIDLPLDD